jgi:hypothetical protein
VTVATDISGHFFLSLGCLSPHPPVASATATATATATTRLLVAKIAFAYHCWGVSSVVEQVGMTTKPAPLSILELASSSYFERSNILLRRDEVHTVLADRYARAPTIWKYLSKHQRILVSYLHDRIPFVKTTSS